MAYIIDKNLDVLLYVQVEHALLKLINEDPYNKGFYLPTELELMKRFGVSRHTIRKAMDNLVMKEIVIREKGRGTKLNLNRKKVKTVLSAWHSFTDEMNLQGIKFKYLKKEVEIVPLRDNLRKIFDINNKSVEDIIKLTRVRGESKGEIYFESYFNPDLNLKNDIDFINGNFDKLYDYLEKNHGIFTIKSEEEISAMLPTKKLANLLEIDMTLPLLCRKRLVYDKQGRKVEYNLGYYRSDKFIYSVHLER